MGIELRIVDKLSTLSDSGVLEALNAVLPPAELAQTLAYMLRVPEAWQKLHEPTFLHQFIESPPRAPFTPSEIALAVVGVQDTKNQLPDELEGRLSVLTQTIAEGKDLGAAFEDIALLAFGIARQCEIEGGIEEISSLALIHPFHLRSTLACSWQWLEEPQRLIAPLVEQGKLEGIALAIHTLLANVPVPEAAKYLLSATPHDLSHILLKIRKLAALGLAHELATVFRAQIETGSTPQPPSPSDGLTRTASHHLALGEIEPAREALSVAWENASQNTAEIADQVADIARVDEDRVLEVEARQQALAAYATPVRRANLALALEGLERNEDALSVVHQDPTCVEERIVAGLVLAKLGEIKQAGKSLMPAVQRSVQNLGIEDHWLRKLADGLRAIGEIRSELQVIQARLERVPTNVDARIDFVRALESAGDPHSAAQQAELTLALDPTSTSAKVLLASNLQRAGRPGASLPHWQELVADEPEYLWDLVECALDANALEIATDAAQRLTALHPEDARVDTVLGKVLTAQGSFEIAREHLENAVQVAPEQAEAWIALADCQQTAGDVSAAGETLSQAIQRSPNNSALQSALASWLRMQGRLNDAKTIARRASELEPDNVQRLTEYAQILNELGHQDDALPIFLQALSKQPENWEVRIALGKTYEARNEPQAAARLLSMLPVNAPPEAHFLAGRVLIQSADSQQDPNLTKGCEHLQDAKRCGITDPTLEYWLGRAQELMGRNDQAFLHYQASLQGNEKSSDHEFYLKAALGAARAALTTDQVHLALSTLEAARERFPASKEVLNWLAKSYLAAGLPDQAMQVAYQATEIDPNDSEPLRILCKATAKVGDWEKAIQATERLLELVPEDKDSWVKLGQFSHNLGMRTEARDALARGLWLGRHDPRLLQLAAQLFVDFQDPKAAQRIMLRTASLEPNNPRIQEQLARISEEVGELETAQRAWRLCIELEPDNLVALDSGAENLMKLGRRSSAIGLWQRAIGIDKSNPDLNVKLARAHIANGELQNGLNHYQQAIESRPTSAELAIEVGSAVLRYGAPQEAVEVLQNAIHLAPDLAKPKVDLAECFMKLERFSEARELLERAKNQSHYPPRTDALLALIALESGDLIHAKHLLVSSRLERPLALEDVSCISDAALRMGLWKHALDVLEESSSDHDSAEKLVEGIRLRLRIMDAHWLYAVAGKATYHAPDEKFVGPDAERAITSLLERCSRAGASVSTINTLKRWASYSFGDGASTLVHTTDEKLSTGAGGEQLHAFAIACLKAGQPEAAAQILASTTQSLNPDAWGALLLGLSHASLGENTQALQAYEYAEGNPVIQPLAKFLSGQAKWKQGDEDEALEDINTALSAWPEEAPWHFRLASMYEKQARFDTAIPHLQQAIDLVPGNGDYLLAYARALRHSGQLSESLASYKQLLQVLPEQGFVWKEAAQLAMANGEAELAQTWFERASTLSPSDPACLIGAAQAAMMQGYAKVAMAHVEAAARLAPDDLDVLVGMGEILARQGKFEKALRAYDQVMKRTKDQLNVRIARSKLLVQIGRAKHALMDLQEMLEERPDEERLWAALAEAHEAQEDFEAAIDAASHATRLSPRETSYRLLMGRLCRRSGQLDRALDELLKAQANGTLDALVSRELGLVYEQRREMPLALEAFQRALHLDPEDEQSHYMAGLIYKQQKAYHQAARMFERAVEINPKDSEALQQLAAVRALELVHGGI